MDPILVAVLGMVGMFALILLHVPIGIAMIVVGVVGFSVLTGNPLPYSVIATEAAGIMSSVDLAVVPLFLLMGSFATAAGISTDVYRLAYAFLGHRRGGLAYATVGGSAMFGAICGSSVATAATFGRVALPQMLQRGYAPHFAAGTVAAGGTLGIIVPPSVIMVIYAVIAEQFVLDLFKAAVIPAAIAIVFHVIAINVATRLWPSFAPATERSTWSERLDALRSSWPVVMVIVVVFGGIYGGIFTVNEGAAVGAGMCFLLALLRGRMTWESFWRGLMDTAANTAMVYLVIVGAAVFTYFITLSHAPEELVKLIGASGLPNFLIVVVILALYVVLGAVFDEVAAMVITLPFVLPMIIGMGYDPIWWGIINVVVIEIGMICPPIGINVFVIHGIAKNIPLAAIYRGILPFLVSNIARLLVLAAFPWLTLWLVQLGR